MLSPRGYKWLPDVPDHRDKRFSLTPAVSLPDYVPVLDTNDQVEDQGQLGSCTGNAATTALEITLKATENYSRLMAYYTARKIEGTTKQDAGAYIRDVIKGVCKYGVATETMWPYLIEKFARKPSAKAYKNAKLIPPRIKSYERLDTIQDIKTALAMSLPVVFGFSVPDYFESDEVAKTGWVRLPTDEDEMIGGHAVTAVGYDERNITDPEPFIWVRNSWGTGWGLNGDFKMVYGWFTDKRRLVDDVWVMHPENYQP